MHSQLHFEKYIAVYKGKIKVASHCSSPAMCHFLLLIVYDFKTLSINLHKYICTYTNICFQNSNEIFIHDSARQRFKPYSL